MKIKQIAYGFLSFATTIALVACNNGNANKESKQNEENMTDHSGMNMDHKGSTEVPEGLKVAEKPEYEVGSKVIITADHMKGMKGAEATIVGAYDTIAYAVSYTPTNGGEEVTNHKWVIQEEIPEASGDEELKTGTEVTLEASHMEEMKGAKATIDYAEKTTVYMIDFTPTTGGEKVTNHKWVTESELSPVQK